MENKKIGKTIVYQSKKSAYDGYKGKITTIRKDYLVISNGTSSLVVGIDNLLTDRQSEMLEKLESFKNGETRSQKDIELYGSNWIIARSLEEKGLVEIYTNELSQSWVKLKED